MSKSHTHDDDCWVDFSSTWEAIEIFFDPRIEDGRPWIVSRDWPAHNQSETLSFWQRHDEALEAATVEGRTRKLPVYAVDQFGMRLLPPQQKEGK